jgi:predicted nuclease of predicted toxin-antitoxin system
MKFIIDAQLPVRLKNWLTAQGYDSIHTDEIALETHKEPTDSEIAELALQENRTVISKDSDFFKSHILTGKPPKLLFITTGNIVNNELLLLFETNFETALQLFNSYDIVEMNNFFVVGHGK